MTIFIFYEFYYFCVFASHHCLRREINILVQPIREQDFTVKILSHIIGFLLEEFDSGVFELNW